MNIWKAKYEALAAGIMDKTLIDNAEKLVNISMELSVSSIYPFDDIFRNMLIATNMEAWRKSLRSKVKLINAPDKG